MTMDLLNSVSFAIGIVGVVVMAWGVLLSVVGFLQLEYISLKGLVAQERQRKRMVLRQQLGSYILLSLEFMIAGDIIHTVLRPNKDALIVLGSIVAIRTVISYFLHKELASNT